MFCGHVGEGSASVSPRQGRHPFPPEGLDTGWYSIEFTQAMGRGVKAVVETEKGRKEGVEK